MAAAKRRKKSKKSKEMKTMTKIDIFSGFLGAGKTTLIKKLIAEAWGRLKRLRTGHKGEERVHAKEMQLAEYAKFMEGGAEA